MVHEKYTHKNGKTYGPYLYENKRVNGKIHTDYLGKARSFSVGSFSKTTIAVVVLLALVFAFFYFFSGSPTGKVSLSLSDSYAPFEVIDGKFSLGIKSGEIIPVDSVVRVSLNGQSKEIILSDLVDVDSVSGSYFAEGASLSGAGKGYGVAGTKAFSQPISFSFRVISSDSGESSSSDDSPTNGQTDNSTNSGSGSEGESSGGAGEGRGSDSSESAGSSGGGSSGESPSGGSESSSDGASSGEAQAGGSEGTGSSAGKSGESSGSGNVDSSGGEGESSGGSIVEGNGNSDGADAGSSSGNAGNSNNVGNSGGESGDSAGSSGGEGNAGGSSAGASGSSGGGDSGSSSSGSDSAGSSGGEGGLLGGGITGAVISEEVGDGEIIEAELSSGVYSYDLPEGYSAELVSGSVKIGGESLADSAIDFSVENGEVIVSSSDGGFGQEYLGDVELELDIDLSEFGINASESGTLNVELLYNNISIVGASKQVSVDGVIAETNETILLNESASLNETLVLNETNVSINELVLIKSIPDVRIAKNSFVELNLSEYFFGAEDYLLNVSNISLELSGESATLTPEENFSGLRKGRVSASSGNFSLESNEFNILVSSGAVRISTSRERIVVGQLVRWKQNVSLETPENVSIELPAGAENISVKKNEESSGEIVEANSLITGGVIGVRSEGNSLYRFIQNIFSSMTGRVIADLEVAPVSEAPVEENAPVSVTINDSATEYVIEYQTEAPTSSEEETSSGKRVVVSGPDALNYTDVLAFANIREVYSIEQQGSIKVYWVENASYLPFDAYDLDANGMIDYIEWNVPHLSNQTFEIILITQAEHLDENRTFIEDVYPQVGTLDGVSKVVPSGHYVRVYFEKNLTNVNDITVYAHSTLENESSSVSVFEIDSEVELVSLANISYSNSSFPEYKTILTTLAGEQDRFDLLVSGADIEIDYIIDPTITNVVPNGTLQVIWFGNMTEVTNPAGVNPVPTNGYTLPVNCANYISATGDKGACLNLGGTAALDPFFLFNVTLPNYESLDNVSITSISAKILNVVENLSLAVYNYSSSSFKRVNNSVNPTLNVNTTLTYFISGSELTNFVSGNKMAILSYSQGTNNADMSQEYLLVTAGYTAKPVVTLSTPADLTTATTATHSFYATFTSDPANTLVNATLYIWNSTNGVVNSTYASFSGISNSSNISVTLPYGGTFKWNYVAFDSAGYSDSATFNNTLTYQVIPVISSVTLSASSAGNLSTDNLNGYVSAYDLNNENITLVYNWYKEGVLNATNVLINDPELKLYLPLNNDSMDYALNNNGTKYGDTSNASGRVGGSYTFDGTGDYVEIPDNDSIDSGANNFTIALWAYPTTAGVRQVLLGKSDGSGWEYQLEQSDTPYTGGAGSYLTFILSNRVDTSCYLTDANVLTFDRWEFIVAWYDNEAQTLNLQRNNGVVNSISCVITGTASTLPLTLGRHGTYDGVYYVGKLDELQFYNRSLTSDERTVLYYGGLYGGEVMSSAQLTAGDNWTLGVKAGDYLGFSAETNSSNLFVRTAVVPVINSVVLNATSVFNLTSDNLTGYVSASDADGQAITNAYNWYKNNTLNATTAFIGDANLTLYLPFNNDTKDYVFSNDGTIGGSAVLNTTSGVVGSSFNLDGGDDVVSIPNSSLWNFGTSNFAISLWAYPTSFTSYNGLISGASYDNACFSGYSLYMNGDGVIRLSKDCAFSDLVTSVSAITLNAWNHIVLVRNGTGAGDLNIYLNGVSGSSPASGNVAIDSDGVGLIVGRYYAYENPAQGLYFDGQIDEVQIYNRSLSASEIQQLYTGSRWGGNILDSSQLSAGDNWTLGVRAGDFDSWSAETNSSSLTANANLPPTIGSVVLNATSALNRSTDNLTGYVSASDNEGENYTLVYNWYENGTLNGTTAFVSDADLVAYFSFNNDSKDYARGFDGTAYDNAALNLTAGRIGNSFNFDGSGDYVDIGDIDLDYNMTISVWIKTVLGAGTFGIVTKADAPAVYYPFELNLNTGGLVTIALSADGAGTGYDPVSATTTVNDGNWHQIVATYSYAGSNLSIYVDGVVEGSKVFTGPMFLDNNPVRVGRHPYNVPTRDFAGQIDELQIYNRSLSASEVRQLYTGSRYGGNIIKGLYYTQAGQNWTLGVRAGDYLGWSAETNSTPLVVSSGIVADTTAPLVTIVLPANVTYNSVPLLFNISLNENGTAWYSLNGGAVNYTMSGNESANFGTMFNATNTSIADGSYTFYAYANDTAGNTNYTENVTFSVDTTAPLVTINSPTGNISVSQVTFNVTTNENADTAQFSLDGGAINVTMQNNGNIDFNYTNSSIVDGTYTVNFYVNDSAGNWNRTESFVFTIDTTAPGVTIVKPANTTYTSANLSLVFNVSLSEAGSIVNYSLNNGVTNFSMLNSTGDLMWWNASNASLADGSYTFRVYAWDSAGNLNASENVTFSYVNNGIANCTSITSAGNYSLIQTIHTTANTACIQISSSNVVLDGKGYWIHGNRSSAQVAVAGWASNRANITIQNLNINGTGSAFSGGGNVGYNWITLKDLVFENFSGTGLRAEYGANMLIQNVTGRFGTGDFINAFNMTNLTIKDFFLYNGTSTNNLLDLSSNNQNITIKDGILSNAQAQLFFTGATSNLVYVENVTFIGNGTFGSSVYGVDASGSNLVINKSNFSRGDLALVVRGQNITLIDSQIDRAETFSAVLIQNGAKNAQIINNIITNQLANNAIQLSSSGGAPNNTVIAGNNISGGLTNDVNIVQTAGQVLFVENNTIRTNLGSGSIYGVLLNSAGGNATLRGNTIDGRPGTAGSSGCFGLTAANNTLVENNVCNNASVGIVITSSSHNGLVTGNTFTNLSSGNIKISTNSNGNLIQNNTYSAGLGSSVTTSYGTYVIDTLTGWEYNISDAAGNVNFNSTSNYLELYSAAAGLNNATIYNLTNALLHNGSATAGNSELDLNDGSASISNFGGTANNWIALNNYNVTEGVGRQREVIGFSSGSDSLTRIQSNLTSSVNSSVVLSVSSCSVTIAQFRNSLGTQLSFVGSEAAGFCGNITSSGYALSLTIGDTNNITFVSDTTSPKVNLMAPANGSSTNTRTIWFASNFTDETALLNATLYVWNSTNDLINATENVSISGVSNSSNISVVLPTDGMFLWNYFVVDSSGNYAFNATNWTLSVDTTAPTITLNSPANNSNFNTTSVNFTVTSSETISWCGLSIDGTANVTMTILGTTIGNYTNTSMTNGNHNFIISCNDTANNFANTGVNFLLVDNGYPSIDYGSLTPADASVTSGNSIYVNATASDSLTNVSTFVDFDNSLVSWWRMDDLNASGGVVDYLGRNNGTNSGATQTNAGKMGKAMSFDGSSESKVSYSSSSLNVSGFVGTTITLWVKENNALNYNAPIYSGNGYGPVEFFINSAGTVYVRVTNSSGNYVQPTATGVTVANWAHLAFTYNNSYAVLYVNGIVGSPAYLGGSILNTNTLTLGGGSQWGGFNGSIDDVMIFNRSLSAEEIASLYANQTTKYYTNNFTSLSAGSHTFKAYTQDYAGNVNFTTLNTVTVDTTASGINFTSPTPDNSSSVTTPYVLVNTSITNAGDLRNVSYNWNGTSYSLYDDSLVLFMNLNNNSAIGENATKAVDVSKYGNNGTIVGAVWNTSGKHGGAMSFDGVNDYVNVSDSPIFGFGNKTTVSAWFKMSSAIGYSAIVMKGSDAGTNYEYLIDTGADGQTIRFFIEDATGYSNILTSSVLASRWYHVTGVANGTNLILYLDGVQVDVDAQNKNIQNTAGSLTIGRNTEGGDKYFKGSIDDVMIFNRSLSAGEVSQLYMSSLSKHSATEWDLYVNQSLNATTGLGNGVYTYSTTAIDTAGNSNTTELRTVTVDVDYVAPTITLLAPANASTFTTRTVWFASNFSDNFALLNATLYVWNSTNDLINATENRTLSGTLNSTNISVVLPYDGTFLWNYFVVDSVGNNAFNSTNWTVNIDTTAPLVTINSPTGNISVSQVTFNVTTNENADTAQFSLDGGAINVTMQNNGNTDFNYTNSSIVDGTYTVNFYVNDSAGNWNRTESFVFTIDTSAPGVTINYPANVTYLSNSLPLMFNVSLSEAGSIVNYSLNNGVTNFSMLNSTTDLMWWNASNSSLADGSYTFRVYAWDSAGNRNATESVVFSFENNVINSCRSLDRANTAYSLSSNVNSSGTCFNVIADNVSLNCNGYAINFSQRTVGQGVNARHKTNFTLNNCDIVLGNTSLRYAYPVFVYNMTNSLVENNTLTTNTSDVGLSNHVLAIYQASNITARNNIINAFGNSTYGVYSSHALVNVPTNILIENNTIVVSGDIGYGIIDYYSSNNRILNNRITLSGLSYGFGVIGGYSTLNGNLSAEGNNIVSLVNRTSVYGIYFYLANSSSMLNNNINASSGIYLAKDANVQVQGNAIYGTGVSVYGSFGLLVSNSSSSSVVGNRIENAGRGIMVLNTGLNNLVYENNISLYQSGASWPYGIYVGQGASRNNVSNNRVLAGPRIALYLGYNSYNNSIYNNFLNTSYLYPVAYASNIAYTTSTSDFNTSLVAGTNIVNGNLMGGNYYTTATKRGYSQICADADNNAICDSSYALSSYHTDYLPLTTLDATPPSIIEITYLENNSFVNGGITIRADAQDNVGIQEVYFQYKNSTIDWTNFTGCSDHAAPYTCVWQSGNSMYSNNSEGYDVKVIAYDYAGNNAFNLSHYTIDRLKPILYESIIVYPSGQTSARTGQGVQLRANVTDSPEVGAGINNSVINSSLLSGISSYQTMDLVAGSVAAQEESIWEKNVTVTSASSGYITATLKVSDRAIPTANIITAGSYWRVYVDNAVPTYSFLEVSGTDETIYNNTDVSFSMEAEDNYQLDNYVFSTNMSGAWVNDSSVAFVGGTIEDISVVKRASAGTHGYRFYVYDDAGNVNDTGIQTFTVSSLNSPVSSLMLDSPADLYASNNPSVQFDYFYTGTPADNCTLMINDVDNQTEANPARLTSLSFLQSFADGTYSWRVRCEYLSYLTEEENTTAIFYSDTRTFLIDSAVPSVKIDLPLNASYTTSVIDFNVTAYDRVESCVLSVNDWDSNYSMSMINSTLYNASITLSASGGYVGRVSCNSSANNINGTESVAFNSDFVTPKVNLLAPANGSNTILTSNYFNASFSDDLGLANATLYVWNSTGSLINATENRTISGTANSANISVVLPAYGNYTWNYKVFDNFGNNAFNKTNFSIEYLFSDSVYPVFSANKTNLTSSTAVGEQVYFNITLTEANPLNYILSWYNGTNWENTTGSYTNGQEVSVLKTINTDLGQINWTWFANDSSGNTNQTDVWSVSLAYDDQTAPVVILLAPTNGSLTNNRTVSFASNFTDETSLLNATLYIWNSTGGLINSTENRTLSGTLNSTNISVVLPYDGLFLWNYFVVDSVGNNAFNSTNWTLSVDTTRPYIELLNPGNGVAYSATSRSVSFQYNVTENVSYCNLTVNSTIVNSSLAGFANYAVNLSEGAVNTFTNLFYVGSYSWNITCEDLYGNVNTSATRTFSVTAPVAESVDSGSGSTGGGGGGGGSSTTVNLGNVSLTVSPGSLEMSVVEEVDASRKITVTNNGNYSVNVRLSVVGKELANVVVLPESFILQAGASEEFNVVVNSPRKGLISGNIVLTAGGEEYEIPVIVNVKSENFLFDVSVSVLNLFKRVKIGDDLRTQFNLLQVGPQEKVDVVASYIIKDFEGNVFLEDSETFFVLNSKDYVKEFHTANLPVGKYFVGVEIVYPGAFATSSAQFEVVDSATMQYVNAFTIAGAVIALLVIGGGIWLAVKFRRRKI